MSLILKPYHFTEEDCGEFDQKILDAMNADLDFELECMAIELFNKNKFASSCRTPDEDDHLKENLLKEHLTKIEHIKDSIFNCYHGK